MQSRLPLTSLLVYIRVIFDPFSFFKVVQFNNVWNSCDAMLFIVRSPCTWLPAHPSVCMYTPTIQTLYACMHSANQRLRSINPRVAYTERLTGVFVSRHAYSKQHPQAPRLSLWRRLAHNSDRLYTACTLILISSSSACLTVELAAVTAAYGPIT